MRVLLLTDLDFALRECHLVDRLAVGLMGAGVSVARGAPMDVNTMRKGGLIACANYRDDTLPWARSMVADDFLADLEADGWGKDKIDVIHAFGRKSWPLAFTLAEKAGGAVVLEMWSADLLSNLPGEKRKNHIGAYMAPGRKIGELLRRKVNKNLVQVAPWGVLAPEGMEIRTPFSEMEKCISLVTVGSGHDIQAYRAMFVGLATIIDHYPQIVMFVSAPEAAGSKLYSMISELDLQGQVSLIPDAEASLGIVFKADMLLLPEARGEYRSLALDAMAAGMVVTALKDEYVDYLSTDETAILIETPIWDKWAHTLDDILHHPSRAVERALASRKKIQNDYTASRYIETVHLTYEKVIRGEVLSFT